MSLPNPIELQRCLSGVEYPADRDALVEHAKSKGAGDDILRHLSAMPEGSYDGPDKVSQAFERSAKK